MNVEKKKKVSIPLNYFNGNAKKIANAVLGIHTVV